MWLDASGNATFLRVQRQTRAPPEAPALDPDLEEASEAPPYILLIDNWFPIHRRRRRRLSLTP